MERHATQNRTPRTRRLSQVIAAFIVALLTVTVGASTPSASAEDLALEDPDGALALAQKYAPIMMLKAQEQACDEDGEPYGPTSVDILLENPEILLRQVGPGDPVVKAAPTAEDLFGLGLGFFLDSPGGALEPACIYETDFLMYSRDQPGLVYAHIVKQDGHPDQLALQYWFYWYYNDWNNKHEGDWEGIQLLFSAATIEQALATEPVSVGYAQHEGAERADWESSKLEREGTHPVVYSSAGSHASYFGSAVYLGRSGSEGFGCDNTDGPSDRVEPDVVVLPDAVDDPGSPLAWLNFGGRWGERQAGPFNGPTGPTAKARWLEPIDWHEELRPGSVVIPAGDSAGAQVISGFCGVVKWGSGALISWRTSPTRVVLSIAVAFLLASWLARRTQWERVAGLPLVRRRRAGQIIRLAGTAYHRAPRPLLTFGLFYLPAAALGVLLAALVAVIPFLGDILDLSKGATGTDLFVTLLAGGIPNLIGLVLINAMMVVYLNRADADPPPTVTDAAKLAWERKGDLASGLFRAGLIVLVLFITVIGIPWGVRQLVRYQFMPHAVMLEDLDGRQGLARSSELVSGRWWHTAVFLSIFNGMVLGLSLALGIVLLVVFSQIPLWLFSALITVFFALFVPLSALALTLLYGDARAEEQGAGPAEVRDPSETVVSTAG